MKSVRTTPSQVRASQLKRVQEQSAESLRKQLTELERAMRHARSELIQISEAVSRREAKSQQLSLELERARNIVAQLVARAAGLEETCATRSLQTQTVRSLFRDDTAVRGMKNHSYRRSGCTTLILSLMIIVVTCP